MKKDDKLVLIVNLLFLFSFLAFMISFINETLGLRIFQFWFIFSVVILYADAKDEIKEIWEDLKNIFKRNGNGD